MSGVRAAKSVPVQALPGQGLEHAEVQAMQDVLYDILANGVDPDRDIPIEEVERFLFEHARSPKSLAEFHAFFTAHGLTIGKARRSAVPVSLVLPPIERPEERAMPPQLPVELSVLAETTPPAVAATAEHTGARLRRPSRWGLWAAVATGCALLGGAGFYGYTTIVRLEGELARTAAHSRDNQRALESLRDEAVGLQSSVAANSEIVQRVDQKSDLLIQSFTAAQEPKKPARRRGASGGATVQVPAGSESRP